MSRDSAPDDADVERVARALWGNVPTPYDQLQPGIRDTLRKRARDAIAAYLAKGTD